MVNTRSKSSTLKNLSGSAEVLTKGSGLSATRSKKQRAKPATDVEESEKKRQRFARGESDIALDQLARKPDDGTLEALPMDIVLEILSYLHPLDLLQLARTTRIFRNLLMSKNSCHIWRASRIALNLKVPECPPDRSEPQWAKLVLDLTCPTCDSKDSTEVEWGLRVRGCRACFEKNLIYGSEAPRAFPGVNDIKKILDLLPFTYERTWCPPLSIKRSDRQYYQPAIQPMIDLYRSLRKRVLANAPGANEQLNTFVAQRKQNVTDILDAEGSLMILGDEHAQLRESKIREEIEKWQELYREKLIALGYDQADASRASGESFGIRLEDGWEKNRAYFEDNASRMKVQRLAWERSSNFSTLCRTFLAQTDKKAPVPGLWPSPGDLIDMDPKIQEILDHSDEECYQDELKNIFPIALDKWWESSEEILVEKIFDLKRQPSPAHAPVGRRLGLNQDAPSGEDLLPSFASPYAGASGSARQAILGLAKSVFTCSCRGGSWLKDYPIYWDGSLKNHGCSWVRFRPQLKCSADLYDMEFDEFASNQVDAICATLGLDANQARFTELDELDARFRCTKCSNLMNWRVAIKHRDKGSKVSQRAPPIFARISDEEAVIVKAFELDNPDMTCPHGRIRSPLRAKAFHTTRELLDYLKANHNQNELAPDSYWLDPSVPPKPVLETDVFKE